MDKRQESQKPIASLSIDMDNQWSYMKTHGDEGWDEFPTYYPVLVPYVLNILDELDLKITFFIVGKDADVDENRSFIKEITGKGHELGNHSYSHEPWLHLYNAEDLEKDILRTHELLTDLAGVAPKGFRGPGFSWSKPLLDLLIQAGYEYDGSTLPTFIGPLARWYYFRTSDFTKEERQKRQMLFGKFSEGFRKLRPYRIAGNGNGDLLEIPVTTIPIIRTPFHLSYLHYLAGISRQLMLLYLKSAISLCKLTSAPINFIVHPLDLLSGEHVPDLAFFPGMNLSASYKREVFWEVIEELKSHFHLLPMGEFANILAKP